MHIARPTGSSYLRCQEPKNKYLTAFRFGGGGVATMLADWVTELIYTGVLSIYAYMYVGVYEYLYLGI